MFPMYLMWDEKHWNSMFQYWLDFRRSLGSRTTTGNRGVFLLGLFSGSANYLYVKRKNKGQKTKQLQTRPNRNRSKTIQTLCSLHTWQKDPKRLISL